MVTLSMRGPPSLDPRTRRHRILRADTHARVGAVAFAVKRVFLTVWRSWQALAGIVPLLGRKEGGPVAEAVPKLRRVISKARYLPRACTLFWPTCLYNKSHFTARA